MLGSFVLHGPCVVDDDSYFFDNPYSWTKKLNIVYIDAPAGVGFSYARSSSDKKFNDFRSADDNMKAVLSFYKKFPEFRQNEVYLAGESYTGIYVPYLAQKIHQHNIQTKTHAGDLHINLKGFMVGNAVADWKVDTENVMMEFAYMHNLVTKDTYFQWKNNKCEKYHGDVLPGSTSKECVESWNKMQTILSDLNPYDIYRDEHPPRYEEQERIG